MLTNQKLSGEPSSQQIPVEGCRVVLDGLTLPTLCRRSDEKCVKLRNSIYEVVGKACVRETRRLLNQLITERRQKGCIAAQRKPGYVGCFSLCPTYSTRQLGTPNYLVTATDAQKQDAEFNNDHIKGENL